MGRRNGRAGGATGGLIHRGQLRTPGWTHAMQAVRGVMLFGPPVDAEVVVQLAREAEPKMTEKSAWIGLAMLVERGVVVRVPRGVMLHGRR